MDAKLERYYVGTTCQRDSFARGELVRFSSGGSGDCAWCGQTRKKVFSYVWWNDGRARPNRGHADHWFCGLDCMKAFSY